MQVLGLTCQTCFNIIHMPLEIRCKYHTLYELACFNGWSLYITLTQNCTLSTSRYSPGLHECRSKRGSIYGSSSTPQATDLRLHVSTGLAKTQARIAAGATQVVMMGVACGLVQQGALHIACGLLSYESRCPSPCLDMHRSMHRRLLHCCGHTRQDGQLHT